MAAKLGSPKIGDITSMVETKMDKNMQIVWKLVLNRPASPHRLAREHTSPAIILEALLAPNTQGHSSGPASLSFALGNSPYS